MVVPWRTEKSGVRWYQVRVRVLSMSIPGIAEVDRDYKVKGIGGGCRYCTHYNNCRGHGSLSRSGISLSHNVWATGYHPDDRRPRSGLSRADSGVITDDVRADPTLTPRVAVFGNIYLLQPSGQASRSRPPARVIASNGANGANGALESRSATRVLHPGSKFVQDGGQARPASYDIMMHQPCAGKKPLASAPDGYTTV